MGTVMDAHTTVALPDMETVMDALKTVVALCVFLITFGM